MSNVPWSLVSVSNIDHDGAISDQTVIETRSLQQVRSVRDPPVFLTKAQRTSIMNCVSTREIDTAKWVRWRGISGLRAHKVCQKPPKSFNNRVGS